MVDELGFKVVGKAGRFPFDANAVDYSKCVKDHLQKTITAMPLSPSKSSDSSLSVLRSHFTFIEESIGDEKALLFMSVHGEIVMRSSLSMNASGVYLGTKVAIKKIKLDEDMKLMTHLEVQIMRQLRHPNIITLMGSKLLIVKNLVNGFNLDQVIFKQALPLHMSTIRSKALYWQTI
eukprot:Em0001g1280a